jgi:hypothetical protein
MPRTKSVEVVRRLSNYGTKVDEFCQDERQKAVNSKFGKQGYCTGCCLDWIRRVMQAGRPAYTPRMDTPHNYECERNERIMQQTQRMVLLMGQYENQLAQENTATRSVKTTVANVNDSIDELNKLNRELTDLYNAWCNNDVDQIRKITDGQRRLIRKWCSYDLRPQTVDGAYDGYKVGELIEQIDALREQLRADAKKEVASRQTTAPRPTQKTVVHAMMEDPENLDTIMDRLRKRQNRNPLKKRYSSLQVVASRANVPFKDIHEAIERLVTNANFSMGNALRIGFEYSDNLGHSIAVYKQANGNCYFFDPNYGIFSASPEQTVEALTYLASVLYTEDVPLVNQLDYELFRKK